MFIDVIIPFFNRKPLLKRAIESVLSQSYKNINIFLVNDGSTEITENKLSDFFSHHPQIQLLQQKNKGVSAARNLGIRKSSSEWLAFLDSDDEWLPHKIEKQVNLLKEYPELRFIHSDEIWIRNGVRVNPKKKFDKNHDGLFRRSLETCLISPSTVLLKRELCEEHGLFDESFEICEDYDLWLKILAQEDVGFVNEFLIRKHGGHADQLSTAYPAMDAWRIRSLINLYKSGNLSHDKKLLVFDEIKKKGNVLLLGYLKHEHFQKHQDLSQILASL